MGLIRSSAALSTRVLLALITMSVAATAAGAGAVTWGARNAILEARQDVYLETFDRNSSEVVDTLPDRPTAEELRYAAMTMGADTVILDLSTDARGGDVRLDQVPVGLRRVVETAQTSTEFRRTQVDGVPTFVIGARIEPDDSRPDRNPVALYTFYPLTAEYAQVADFFGVAGVTTLLVALVATGVGLALASRLRRPLAGLGEAIATMGGGAPAAVRRTGYPDIDAVLVTLAATDAALEDTLQRLRGSEAEARRLVADVAHELRTPLAAMVAVAEILEDVDRSTTEDVAAAGALMARSTRHLARLTDDILAMSRSDVGDIDLALGDVDVEALVRDLVETRGWTDVEIRLPAGLVLRTDAARVTLILANLLGNAHRHGRAPITLDAELGPVDLRIIVSDAGAGVPAGLEELVFERFFKIATDRGRSESSGLGLAIVRENARQLGGDVRYRPGDRPAFEVRLPLA